MILLRSMFLLLFFTFMRQTKAITKTISIVLKPRDYIDPWMREGFICGLDPLLDAKRLVGEQHPGFVFGFFDRGGDQSAKYKTQVFDVAVIKKDGSLTVIKHQDCLQEESALHLLFVVPPKMQCNAMTFQDAQEEGEGYYPVFIGTTGVYDDEIEKFKQEANNLKKYYSKDAPKLCAAKAYMQPETAAAREKTLNLMFSFVFNEETPRAFDASPYKVCQTVDESKNSIITSELFDINPKIWFKEETVRVDEDEGFAKVSVNRECSRKRAIGFIETSFPEQNAANNEDIVPYNGPVVFEENSSEAELFITVKIDQKSEADEVFSLTIDNSKGRKKRALGTYLTKMLVWISGRGVIVEFDNTEAGPFRMRDIDGLIQPRLSPDWPARNPNTFMANTDAASRTVYKSTYSVKLNIPLRAVIELDGNEKMPPKPGNPWPPITMPNEEFDKFVTDLRQKVLPKNWNGRIQKRPYGSPHGTAKVPGDDDTAAILHGGLAVQKGTQTDYTHPFKYTGNTRQYTKGHLVSSQIFRTFFIKERLHNVAPPLPTTYADLEAAGTEDKNLPYAFAAVMTNIFPQNSVSNAPNAAQRNWGWFEQQEILSAKHCLTQDQDNKFYIVKGTIPNGPCPAQPSPDDRCPAATNQDTVGGRYISWLGGGNKPETWTMLNDNWLSGTRSPAGVGNTEVNIPRYMYMGYTCSTNYPAPHQNRYVIFEHQLYEEMQSTVGILGLNPPAVPRDIINAEPADAAALLAGLDALWRTEHPRGTAFHEPYLFTLDPRPPAPGMDNRGFDIVPRLYDTVANNIG